MTASGGAEFCCFSLEIYPPSLNSWAILFETYVKDISTTLHDRIKNTKFTGNITYLIEGFFISNVSYIFMRRILFFFLFFFFVSLSLMEDIKVSSQLFIIFKRQRNVIWYKRYGVVLVIIGLHTSLYEFYFSF